DYDKAMECQGQEIDGAPVSMEKAKAKKKESKSELHLNKDEKTLFVKNLPENCTKEELKELFPGAVEIRIPVDRVTGDQKRFGFIDLSSAAEVKEAVKDKQGSELNGSALFLDTMGGKKDGTPKKGARTGGEQSNTLFVRNLSYDTTPESLKEAFESCVDARVSTDRETGKPKGFGFIDFASPEDAKTALDENNGIEVDGRAVTLDFATPKGGDRRSGSFGGGRGGQGGRGGRGGEQSNTLFVKNLNFDTTPDSLKGAFESCVDARISTDRDTGKPKGFGFIEFASPEDAKTAMDENN
ncbi:unnamed protein product, partial [Owenia fusiformis]